ncbi:MAG: GNAT family N-acetyltransferase [Bacteroidia bacterium]|nr:GNAT family N-acetyltransferase [Bacteroidia bacterium]
MSIEYQLHTKTDLVSIPEKQEIAGFLFRALQKYGDPLEHIRKAIDYAVGEHPCKGGFITLARDRGEVVGAVVINETNMGGYIPEYILVYIAVNPDYRGKGIGKGLMKRALDFADGDIALHVEPDNPARKLYEKFGFTHKYLEMRYKAP